MSTRKLPAMRVLTAVEVSATAGERWLKQYDGRPSDWKFGDGTTAGEMKARISTSEKTPDALGKFLHPAWTHPYCSTCKEYATAVIHCDEGYGNEPIDICLTCAEAFVSLLKQFPGAADKI